MPRILRVKAPEESKRQIGREFDDHFDIEWVPIEKVHRYTNNPRFNSMAIGKVAESIRTFGWQQPIVVDESYVIIAGDTRFQAAVLLGLIKVPVKVAHGLTPEQITAYRLADNKTGEIAEWDFDKLQVELKLVEGMFDFDALGFRPDEIEQLYRKVEHSRTDFKPKQAPEALASLDDYIRRVDEVYVQFSGGKDSTLTLRWAVEACSRLSKPLTAVFVETGAEFPDLTANIVRVASRHGVKLEFLHPVDNIVSYYMGVGKWPDPIFRDCMHKFVNEPVNRRMLEVRKLGKVPLVLRGGRPDQKTRISNAAQYQEVDIGAGETVGLLNPYFSAKRETYDAALKEAAPDMWRGYSLGFVRTACWMCPFQTAQQYNMIKEHYPLLWEEMRDMSSVLIFPKHLEGRKTGNGRFESGWRKFEEYWSRHWKNANKWKKRRS